MKTYWQVSFGYKASSHDLDDQAVIDLERAEKKLFERLKGSGLKYKHAYSFPDGSLFKYFEYDCQNELMDKLREILKDSGVWVSKIYKAVSNEDPYKWGCKTLKEYMEKD